MNNEEKQKLDELQNELINLNNEYNGKLDRIRELEEQINNYKPSKKVGLYLLLCVVIVLGFDELAYLVKDTIPALSTFLVYTLPFIGLVTGKALRLLYNKKNPGVKDLKEELKKTKEEKEKLYPKVSKKREDYHTYKKLLEYVDPNLEEQVEVTSNEDIIESTLINETPTENISNVKVLSLTCK